MESMTILVEELGEVARGILKNKNNTHKDEQHSYIKELVQVAASAISAIERE
jgi:NTP pyrophosphatase (non-canonical NTP hydrolase)